MFRFLPLLTQVSEKTCFEEVSVHQPAASVRLQPASFLTADGAP